jgi:hypothetical protein
MSFGEGFKGLRWRRELRDIIGSWNCSVAALAVSGSAHHITRGSEMVGSFRSARPSPLTDVTSPICGVRNQREHVPNETAAVAVHGGLGVPRSKMKYEPSSGSHSP